MLKTSVGYSILNDSYQNGREVATKSINELNNPKLALLYTSPLCNHESLIQGFKSVSNIPIIGCTSKDAIIVPDGIITGENGFSGSMIFDDENLNVGVACLEKENDARLTGRKVALQAIQNANTNLRPSYFYMIASPNEEESYLKGIQDVIGRVPMFGGSASGSINDKDWKIYCNDKVISEGCAVAFFYTDRKYITEYNGAYHETNRNGIITKISNKRKLEEINGEVALKKYAEWRGLNIDDLKDEKLLNEAITNPFGIKDPMGNITVIRQPIFGNPDYSMDISNDLVEGTGIVMMDSTIDEFIKSTFDTVSTINSKLDNNIAGYLLIHSSNRKDCLNERVNEIYGNLKSTCKDIPFIMLFSYGEYGYHEHSSNVCGNLMLSFTGFEK